MTDVLTPSQRSRCMAAVRSRDTSPEMTVRRIVHAMGFRYRLHDRRLPGCPDLVLPRLKKIIEIRGCFWHRHACPSGRLVPATRRSFWTRKFETNALRDRRNLRRLRRDGWDVLIVWECQLKDAERTRRKLTEFLNGASATAK